MLNFWVFVYCCFTLLCEDGDITITNSVDDCDSIFLLVLNPTSVFLALGNKWKFCSAFQWFSIALLSLLPFTVSNFNQYFQIKLLVIFWSSYHSENLDFRSLQLWQAQTQIFKSPVVKDFSFFGSYKAICLVCRFW
jgi:hypothetical protein